MKKDMELDLIVDGKDITINKFVQKIISGVVSGAVETLEGVEEDWTDITLTITR